MAKVETFELPVLEFPRYRTLEPDRALHRLSLASTPFSTEVLAAAFQKECSLEAVRQYLQSYEASTIHSLIATPVKGHQLISFAIEQNLPACVELLLEYGVSASLEEFEHVPLLAFAIMRVKWTIGNSTEVVKLLLAHGADPVCIPTDMWHNYIQSPCVMAVKQVTDQRQSKWCTLEHRGILAETLHLTHKYMLWKASTLVPTTTRETQIARANNMLGLLRIPFMLIGQNVAASLVMENVYAHIAMKASKPLLLAFAGLSGHGKTELARQMGQLLKMPRLEIDCAQTKTEFGLLGSVTGYASNRYGSPLNNFMAEHTAQPCLVFLDEFDKTDQGVREALLKVMDTGGSTFRAFSDHSSQHSVHRCVLRSTAWRSKG